MKENKAETKNDVEPTPTEITLADLQQLIKDQSGTIESLKEEGANNISQIMAYVKDNYNTVQGDMKAIGDIIAGFAGKGKDEEFEDDIVTTASDVKKIAREAASELGLEERTKQEKESKLYFEDYAYEVQDLLNEDGPDGEPLSKEARASIRKMLVDDKRFTTIHSKNAVRDAGKNFRAATKTYFGMDKTHGFKGSSIDGTGSGGGGENTSGSNLKKFKINSEGREMMTQLGITEDWAQKALAKRSEYED